MRLHGATRMKVGLRAVGSVDDRLQALDFRVRHRIYERAIILVTEELNNGSKHHNIHRETDVEESVGRAYDDAIHHNSFNAGVEMNRFLRDILDREERPQ